ncbi:DUF1616 domain-containing protein [Actinoplanes sp. NPDC051494]|uniref:DUF1616 domain-containing protein n=1 Tax=Actinoplanes sp. NPDC051494 TaxID=3363907 RepID=UPI003789DADD
MKAWIAAATAVGCAALVLLTPRPLDIAGGLLLGFVLPGYALTGALFPRRRALTRIERVVLAPALSLATLVVGGLLLYVCRAPLNQVSWTALTAGVTLAGLVAQAAQARATGSPEPAPAPRLQAAGATGTPAEAHTIMMSVVPAAAVQEPEAPPPGRLPRQLLPLVLVAAILGGAAWLSVETSLSTSSTTSVTAFSASPPGRSDADGNRTVVLKATGLLTSESPYRVTISAVAGDTAGTRDVTPDRDGEWTETVTVPDDVRVTFDLYRNDGDLFRSISVSAAE